MTASEPTKPVDVQTFIVPAALLTLGCNAPAGAIALLLATRTLVLARSGREEEARQTSRMAALACLLTLPVGLGLGVVGYGLESLF